MNARNRLTDVLIIVTTLLDHTLAPVIVAIVFELMDIFAMVKSYNSKCIVNSTYPFQILMNVLKILMDVNRRVQTLLVLSHVAVAQGTL